MLQPPVTDEAAHLGAYAQVDIALDSFPYHGTTTTCEALWMGVPVVTLAGAAHHSRVGVSLLNQAGLAELIAGSATGYVEIAARLAGDRAALTARRHCQRAALAATPLLDGPGQAAAFWGAIAGTSAIPSRDR
jgi:predicted O-linked N-acetylglucosamine transferase (SPINDLY family)